MWLNLCANYFEDIVEGVPKGTPSESPRDKYIIWFWRKLNTRIFSVASLAVTDCEGFSQIFIPHTHRFIAMLRSQPRIEMDYHGIFHGKIRADLSHPCIRAQQVTRVSDYEKDPWKSVKIRGNKAKRVKESVCLRISIKSTNHHPGNQPSTNLQPVSPTPGRLEDADFADPYAAA